LKKQWKLGVENKFFCKLVLHNSLDGILDSLDGFATKKKLFFGTNLLGRILCLLDEFATKSKGVLPDNFTWLKY